MLSHVNGFKFNDHAQPQSIICYYVGISIVCSQRDIDGSGSTYNATN